MRTTLASPSEAAVRTIQTCGCIRMTFCYPSNYIEQSRDDADKSMEQRQHQSIKNVVSHDIDPALEPGTPRPSLKSTSFDNTQKSDKFSVPAAVIGSKVSSAPQTELQHNHFDDQVSIKQEDSDEDDDSFAQGLYIARPLIPRALSSTTSFKASSAAASTSPAPPLPSFRRYVPIAAAAGPTNREPPLKKQKLSVPRSKTGCYTCRKRRIKVCRIQ